MPLNLAGMLLLWAGTASKKKQRDTFEEPAPIPATLSASTLCMRQEEESKYKVKGGTSTEACTNLPLVLAHADHR